MAVRLSEKHNTAVNATQDARNFHDNCHLSVWYHRLMHRSCLPNTSTPRVVSRVQDGSWNKGYFSLSLSCSISCSVLKFV